GSMHLIDVEHGVMGTSAVVGTTIPQAVGYAYALRLQRKDTIVVSFFGDGAVEEGVFHESINFAALKKIPMLFICENNGYAIHSRLLDRQPQDNLVERVRTYGLEADCVDDGDVFKLYELTRQAVAELRKGHTGPRLIECKIYRWKEHVGPHEDFHAGYRSKSEAEPWIANDPVKRLAGMIDPSEREKIEAEVEAEIQDAFEFAEQSPFPEPQELYTDVYKN
ncbi:MAG: thiamine pyrophosphate-dependent dehydrogenase E1 component subunit alpha, partial [Nitrososphaera sp.]|nr:thiamine pyrophosphate-dependent dehydrogenase E1 component subunit alpha [Nitrososphaera sp.]